MGIDPVGVCRLRAGEDDPSRVVFDADASFDVGSVFPEVAPFEGEALGDTKAVMEEYQEQEAFPFVLDYGYEPLELVLAVDVVLVGLGIAFLRGADDGVVEIRLLLRRNLTKSWPEALLP